MSNKATTLSQLELHALKSANYTDKKIAKLTEDVTDALEDMAEDTSKAVRYTKQTLTEAQQAQARENIGAVSTAYVISVFEELKTLINEGNSTAAIAILDNAILDLSILA